MRDIWQRIDTQFAVSIPEVLESLGSLAEGASEDEIARLEGTLGFRLPEDVRQSYDIHDGTGGRDLYAAYGLSDLEEIARNWTEMRGLSEGVEFEARNPIPNGPIQIQWWNPRWVPISDSGSGNHICVDLDPAEGGTPGQLIDWDHERGPTRVIATSLREYLGQFAIDLEAGRLHFDDMGNVTRIG